MLQYSYNYPAYTPSYPSYPSGLLILSRFTNARYARLDVPDWEFRARPGQIPRVDPSGIISRGRSCVRIKTRIGKNPGARLVEKFIIREPGGAPSFGAAHGRRVDLAGPREAAISEGKDRVAQGCFDGKVPKLSPEPLKAPQTNPSEPPKTECLENNPESPKTQEKHENPPVVRDCVPNQQSHLLQLQSPPRDCILTTEEEQISPEPPENSENPLIGQDCVSQQRSYLLPPHPPKGDIVTFEEEQVSSETQQSENSPKSAKKKLKPYAKSKKTDLSKKTELNKGSETEEDKCVISDSEQINEEVVNVDQVQSDVKCLDKEKFKVEEEIKVSKSESLKENGCPNGEDHIAPKLLNFTAQAPPGVKKVQPLKPLENNNVLSRKSVETVNCVSNAKVKGAAPNAKCIEAKTPTKSSPGVTNTSVISTEGDQGSELLKDPLNPRETGEPYTIPPADHSKQKSISDSDSEVKLRSDASVIPSLAAENGETQEKIEKPDGIFVTSNLPVKGYGLLALDPTKVDNPGSTPIAAGKSLLESRLVDKVEQLDSACQNNTAKVDISPPASDVSKGVNGLENQKSKSFKKVGAFSCVKQDVKSFQKRKTAEPTKTSLLVDVKFNNRSTTDGSVEFKNINEDLNTLKRTQNTKKLDLDSLGLDSGVEIKECDVVKGTASQELNKQEENSEKRQNKHLVVVSNTELISAEKTGCEPKTAKAEVKQTVGAKEKGITKKPNLKVGVLNQNGCDSVADQQKNADKTVTETVKKCSTVENSTSGVSSNDAAEESTVKKEGKQGKKKVKKVVKKKSNKENKVDDNNNKTLSLRSLDELKDLFEDYKVVGSEVKSDNLEAGWELLEVIVDMEGTKKKKKVIVKKKGSKVKVTPLEAKPPANPADTATAGDIMRQLSKKRVSLVDEDLNLVGFNPDKRMSITDEVLVEEAALLDKMIRKEMKEARKSSLAFPPICEENVDKEVEEIAQIVKTPSPKRYVPSPQERRELWKKNALRKSFKSLGGFYKPQTPAPTSSSSESDDECDVNCHQKCMELMPNLCGVNQKLMVEALLNLKRGRRSASGPHSRPSLFKMDSGSEGSQGDGRVTPPAPPAKTLPRFRTYTITDFQFLKVLGKGSFGKVLLAELKGSQCYYAVKCLKKDVVLEDDDVECTMIERKVLALGTGHPYFCHLFCTFQTESHLFFVMEYLNGGDLMFHIQQSGRFDEGRARFYAAEIVSALAFLHKLGIVYRDLKLDNVLLDFDGHVRIADFGMCKLQIYLDKTTDTFCGTPDYMAPEIIKGLKYNQCVDWWSFGILLYEMLVGQSPFSGCDEDHLFWSICNERPHMPRHLSQPAVAVLRDLLEKDWTKRLGSSEFGSQDVMNHRFFDGLKWHLLERRQIDPPYKPTTKHPLDTKYFDRAFTSEKPVLTPVDKAILESMDQTQFEGFSYTNPNATE